MVESQMWGLLASLISLTVHHWDSHLVHNMDWREFILKDGCMINIMGNFGSQNWESDMNHMVDLR